MTRIKKSSNEQAIPVTPRERDVMNLLCQGFSSRKIAGLLKICHHTVESYRKKLLRKFSTKTTVEMMLKAVSMLPPEFWWPLGRMKQKI